MEEPLCGPEVLLQKTESFEECRADNCPMELLAIDGASKTYITVGVRDVDNGQVDHTVRVHGGYSMPLL